MSDGPVIRQRLLGGLGNRMFEHMLATELVRRLEGTGLTGDALPEWGIRPPALPLPPGRFTLTGHRVDVARLRYLLRAGLIGTVETSALGCRMELLPPLAKARRLFPGAAAGGNADELIINVRGAEILGPRHKDYRPLPIAYYVRLIAGTGLRPVFMGQLGDDPYSAALRARFPQAAFEPSRGPLADFARLRAARHIAVAVSTFSWLGAWLSAAETIHLPVIGFLHPRRRPDMDLLPLADPRYRFHLFPHDDWTGTEAALREAIEGEEAGRPLTLRQAAALAHGVVWED